MRGGAATFRAIASSNEGNVRAARTPPGGRRPGHHRHGGSAARRPGHRLGDRPVRRRHRGRCADLDVRRASTPPTATTPSTRVPTRSASWTLPGLDGDLQGARGSCDGTTAASGRRRQSSSTSRDVVTSPGPVDVTLALQGGLLRAPHRTPTVPRRRTNGQPRRGTAGEARPGTATPTRRATGGCVAPGEYKVHLSSGPGQPVGLRRGRRRGSGRARRDGRCDAPVDDQLLPVTTVSGTVTDAKTEAPSPSTCASLVTADDFDSGDSFGSRPAPTPTVRYEVVAVARARSCDRLVRGLRAVAVYAAEFAGGAYDVSSGRRRIGLSGDDVVVDATLAVGGVITGRVVRAQPERHRRRLPERLRRLAAGHWLPGPGGHLHRRGRHLPAGRRCGRPDDAAPQPVLAVGPVQTWYPVPATPPPRRCSSQGRRATTCRTPVRPRRLGLRCRDRRLGQPGRGCLRQPRTGGHGGRAGGARAGLSPRPTRTGATR